MTTVPLFQSSAGVLIASADAGFRDRVAANFVNHCAVELASGGADALAKLEQSECDLLILDRNLPDLNAEELRDLAARDYPGVQVAMLDSASPDPFSGMKKNCSGTGRVLPWASEEKPAEKPKFLFEPLPGMVGTTLPMQRLSRLVRLVAPRNTAVLITGPTGSGKELVARAIHQLSPRAERSFVVINCAAIPEALLEAELFGYARGAFTGAVQSRIGRIHAAQGGTLFLDEIGELPMGLQAKLLRFLEYGEVQRLGSTDTFKVDVRVVAATNANLEGRVILPIAREFLGRLSAEQKASFNEDAARLLEKHDWPGNVRELMHVIERALILADGNDCIAPEHLYFSAPNLAEVS